MGSTETLWYYLPTGFSWTTSNLQFNLCQYQIPVSVALHAFFYNFFFTTGINTNLEMEIVVTSNFLVTNKSLNNNNKLFYI